jgi:hypothetical protein
MPAPVDGNEFHLNFGVVAPEYLLDAGIRTIFTLGQYNRD